MKNRTPSFCIAERGCLNPSNCEFIGGCAVARNGKPSTHPIEGGGYLHIDCHVVPIRIPKDAKRVCTCLGTCKGKSGLNKGWVCAMEAAL